PAVRRRHRAPLPAGPPRPVDHVEGEVAGGVPDGAVLPGPARRGAGLGRRAPDRGDGPAPAAADSRRAARPGGPRRAAPPVVTLWRAVPRPPPPRRRCARRGVVPPPPAPH